MRITELKFRIPHSEIHNWGTMKVSLNWIKDLNFEIVSNFDIRI
jgi:hypothetical protein